MRLPVIPSKLSLTHLIGLGLHLQQIAQQELSPDFADLHKPRRKLQDLSDYEHLHQLLHLCRVHIDQNIQQLSVSNSIKQAMCSLVCIEHPDWEGTMDFIKHEGKQAGQSDVLSYTSNLPY